MVRGSVMVSVDVTVSHDQIKVRLPFGHTGEGHVAQRPPLPLQTTYESSLLFVKLAPWYLFERHLFDVSVCLAVLSVTSSHVPGLPHVELFVGEAQDVDTAPPAGLKEVRDGGTSVHLSPWREAHCL